jgi:hypothetical protein
MTSALRSVSSNCDPTPLTPWGPRLNAVSTSALATSAGADTHEIELSIREER